MLDGVMLLWFLLAAASLLFVAIDIRTTPESPVMKWGFALLTAYTGVIGAFLYVMIDARAREAGAEGPGPSFEDLASASVRGIDGKLPVAEQKCGRDATLS